MLQKELEDSKEYQQRESREAQEDRDELQIYRDRCIKLEAEHELRQGEVWAFIIYCIPNLTFFKADTGKVVEQLRTDLEALMNELNDLSRQNDELITSKDSDLLLIRDLGNQLKEYKRKYEQAKTELRSVKGKISA